MLAENDLKEPSHTRIKELKLAKHECNSQLMSGINKSIERNETSRDY